MERFAFWLVCHAHPCRARIAPQANQQRLVVRFDLSLGSSRKSVCSNRGVDSRIHDNFANALLACRSVLRLRAMIRRTPLFISPKKAKKTVHKWDNTVTATAARLESDSFRAGTTLSLSRLCVVHGARRPADNESLHVSRGSNDQNQKAIWPFASTRHHGALPIII
jgi:hypothetical protein